MNENRGRFRLLFALSVAGVLFAGYFTFRELPRLLSDGISSYILGLPACAYGLIVYIAIFGIALKAWQVRETAVE